MKQYHLKLALCIVGLVAQTVCTNAQITIDTKDDSKFAMALKLAGSRVNVSYDTTKANAGLFESYTLDTLVTNAEVVIVGEVASEFVRQKMGTVFDRHGVRQDNTRGIIEVTCTVKVIQVLSGMVPSETNLIVQLRRVGDNPDAELPFLKKGEKCILFLKTIGKTKDGSRIWSTPDCFFGAEPYSTAKATLLQERLQMK